MIPTVLQNRTQSNSQLQVKCIKKLESLFEEDKILNFKNESYFFEGLRGKLDGIRNFATNFKFFYREYLFEFYLSYDQLEYYIFKDEELIRECNLEDSWDEEKHVTKFVKFLKRDLEKLKICA